MPSGKPQTGNPPNDGQHQRLPDFISRRDYSRNLRRNAAILPLNFLKQRDQGVLIPRRTLTTVVIQRFLQVPFLRIESTLRQNLPERPTVL